MRTYTQVGARSHEHVVGEVDDVVLRGGGRRGGGRGFGRGRGVLADGAEGLTWMGGGLRLEDVFQRLLVQRLERAAYHLLLQSYL